MKQQNKKNLAGIAALFCVLNCLAVYWTVPSLPGAILGLKYGIAFAAGYLAAKWLKDYCTGRRNAERAYQLLLCIVTPLVAFYACEMLERDSVLELGAAVIAANYLLYALLFALIRMLIRRKRWSAGVFFAVTLGFALANYYVTEFRGTPLSPMDLFGWKTAVSVASGYLSSFFLTKDVLIAVEMAVFWVWFSREEEKCPGILLERGIHGGCVLVLAGVIWSAGFLSQTLDLWDLQNNIRDYGVMYQLAVQLNQSKMKKPETYDKNQLAAAAEKYNGMAGNDHGVSQTKGY